MPKEVHDRWAQGGEVRKTLLAELEAADWDKELAGFRYFNIAHVTISCNVRFTACLPYLVMPGQLPVSGNKDFGETKPDLRPQEAWMVHHGGDGHHLEVEQAHW